MFIFLLSAAAAACALADEVILRLPQQGGADSSFALHVGSAVVVATLGVLLDKT